jgi:hypothetical protein
MSISPTVDADYRIYPADLAGTARRVVIANVTYQGIEEMLPVLHFVGQTKRLVLTPENVTQLLQITGSILHEQWIGIAILLQPQVNKRESKIVIQPVTRKQRGQPMPIYVSEERRGWVLALSVVGLLFAASTIFVALHLNTLLLALEQLRNNWPLR